MQIPDETQVPDDSQAPGDNQPGSSGAPGTPSPPNPPPKRKTHPNELVSALLKSLPRALKISRNEAISGRNITRKLARAYRDSRNSNEVISSDESLITIPEEDPAPPSQPTAMDQMKDLLGKLSPCCQKFSP